MDDSSRHERFMHHFLKAQPRIYSYLRTMVFNYDDAEDVFQEVAVILWQKFDQFQPDTRFDLWAYKIAYNQVLAFLQKRRRSKLVFSNDALALIADKVAFLNDDCDELYDALRKCAKKLPEQDRTLLRLRFNQPKTTNRRVAASLGRSETAVSRALSRVYMTLLECIQSLVPPIKQGGRR